MWDFETSFSIGQTLTDGVSTNIVDVGPDDMGLGEAVYLQVALTQGATGSLTVTVEASEAADMSGAVERVRYLVDASVVARGGIVLAAPLPTGSRRYLQLRYSGASGGTLTAGLVQSPQTSGMR